MIYREAGQYKVTYEADQAIFPIAQDRFVMLALLAVAFIAVPLVATEYVYRAVLIPTVILALAAIGLNVLMGYCGQVSLGSLVGFVTVLGIAARNGIMLVSHYRHLEDVEGATFGPELVRRGAEERLAPILMTALATGLALLPLVASGLKPGHEVEYPLAVVILGGLVTSTLLNLFLLPPLYLRFGRRTVDEREGPA